MIPENIIYQHGSCPSWEEAPTVEKRTKRRFKDLTRRNFAWFRVLVGVVAQRPKERHLGVDQLNGEGALKSSSFEVLCLG